MGEQDEHITKKICQSAKSLTISLYTDEGRRDVSNDMKRIYHLVKGYNEKIKITFFDSKSLTDKLKNDMVCSYFLG